MGLSGKISFGVKGRRNNILVDIIELKEGGIVKVGNWSDDMNRPKLIMNRTFEESQTTKQTLKNEKFVVVISLVSIYKFKFSFFDILHLQKIKTKNYCNGNKWLK